MKTLTSGQQAEAAVADYLESLGWKTIDKNWRRRRCEIDIIARNRKTVCFIEVKFRANSRQGDGLEYITPRKIKQIKFAAELWCEENEWLGDWAIFAASVEQVDETMSVKEVVEVF